jgi:hypothetical protein
LPAPSKAKEAKIYSEDFADVLILKKKDRLTSAVSNASASTGILGMQPSLPAINSTSESPIQTTLNPFRDPVNHPS